MTGRAFIVSEILGISTGEGDIVGQTGTINVVVNGGQTIRVSEARLKRTTAIPEYGPRVLILHDNRQNIIEI